MKKIFKHINLHSEITHGVCPHCSELTALISITKDLYKCVSCGFDLEQKVNGQISYIPAGKIERFMKQDVPQKSQ